MSREAMGSIAMFCLFIAAMLFGVMLSGCGYGATTCTVVDVAKDVCDYTPIRYMAPDGEIRTEEVPRSEVSALAERSRLHRLAKEKAARDQRNDSKHGQRKVE